MGRKRTTKLERAFDNIQKRTGSYYANTRPTYKNAEVCIEWINSHNFINFKEWAESQENYKVWSQLPDKDAMVDKDIKIQGNKLYSPDTCLLVPRRINALFPNSQAIRGIYPCGVCLDHGKYKANVKKDGKKIHLGMFLTPEDAFYAYKACKEEWIKQVAEEELNKGTISYECYEAILNYKIMP